MEKRLEEISVKFLFQAKVLFIGGMDLATVWTVDF